MADFDPDSLMTAPAPDSASMTIRPPVSQNMRGVLDNIIAPGESAGKYNVIYGGKEVDDLSKHPDVHVPITTGPNAGLYSTAAGKYQFIKSTWDEAAAATGKNDFSPESQDINAAWLAAKTYKDATGRDIEADYASGDPKLRAGIKRALASQWESLGKPGPRQDKLWTLGNDQFKFSDAALSAHDGSDDTSVVYMHPEHYLAFAPSLDDDDAHSATGWQALRSSLAKGEPVNNIPKLIFDKDGKVSGSDGRSRALLAKNAGVDAIPVAIKNISDLPAKLTGASGNEMQTGGMIPKDQVSSEKSGGSIIGRMLGITPAHAEEVPKDEGWEPVESKGADDGWTPVAKDTEAPGPWPSATPVTPPQGALRHIAGAVGSALASPYGPSAKTLAPFTQGGVPIVNAVNNAVLGGGGAALDILSRPFQAIVKGGAATGAELFGKDQTQKDRIERDLNLVGDVASTLGGAAPMTSIPKPRAGLLSKVGRIDASDQAKETIRAGFVLPPAEASEGHIGAVNLTNLAAGEAGKIKLGQLAAAKNQPLVNVYAREDLGLPPQTVLSPQAFKTVRDREGRVYQEVADAVPEVDLARDREFRDDVSKVGNRSIRTEQLFPSTTEPPGVTALRDEMIAHSRGDTQAVMNYIADLRKNATANFQARGDAMAHRFGAAQREAANALESAMERSVKNAPDYYKEKLDQAIARRAEIDADMRVAQPRNDAPGVKRDPNSPHERMLEGLRDERAKAEGDVRDWTDRLKNANAKNQDNQTLLDRFRKARQTMAKSYDVESVTNVSTGDVSATGLGKLLQQGKPLTGNLKLIADSANSFHRAFQNPAAFGGVEPLSVLDVAAAGAMAAHGHPIAAAGMLGRPLIRGRVLRPGYQRRMISDPANSALTGTGAPVARAGAVTAGAEGMTPSDAATMGMTP